MTGNPVAVNASHAPTCGCCDGTGLTEDIRGTERPCSRCRVTEFSDWYARQVEAGRREIVAAVNRED